MGSNMFNIIETQVDFAGKDMQNWVCLKNLVVSFLVSQSFGVEDRELLALLFIVFQMSCYCKCSVALPRGVVGCSAECDCDISLSYSLTF